MHKGEGKIWDYDVVVTLLVEDKERTQFLAVFGTRGKIPSSPEKSLRPARLVSPQISFLFFSVNSEGCMDVAGFFFWHY